MSVPQLTVLAGPTASGKSTHAVAWALRHGAEIVGADSQQVYQGFDLGTAKPSAEELARVRHHLISFVPPREQFSAAQYQEHADVAIEGILRRRRRVLVVGGTGLYLRVLLHGVVQAPGPNAEIRARLNKEAEEAPQALHERLKAVDPVTAAKLMPRDLVRIIRALEIYEQSGKAPSAFHAEHRFAEDRYRYDFFVLNPPRAQLYDAINARTRSMFTLGLVEETKGLLEQGLGDAPVMGAVGYRQARQVVEGELTLEQAVDNTAQETRHYAKRQLTWFKKERGAQLIEPPYAALG